MSDIRLLVADFINELYAKETLEERFKVYEKYVGLLNFDAAVYTFLPNMTMGEEALSKIFLHTDHFSKDFLDHYATEGLEECDFTIRNIMNGDMSVKDWREYELNQWLLKDEADVIEMAREDYGMNNALSIPLMNKGIGGAGVSVISSESDASFAKLKAENHETLVNCTKLFHDVSFNNIQQLPLDSLSFLNSLSEKEQGLLRHLASGKPFKHIMYSIDVASYGVASNMLSSLRERSGEKMTRDRLMYLVGLMDILSGYQ